MAAPLSVSNRMHKDDKSCRETLRCCHWPRLARREFEARPPPRDADAGAGAAGRDAWCEIRGQPAPGDRRFRGDALFGLPEGSWVCLHATASPEWGQSEVEEFVFDDEAQHLDWRIGVVEHLVEVDGREGELVGRGNEGAGERPSADEEGRHRAGQPRKVARAHLFHEGGHVDARAREGGLEGMRPPAARHR